MCFMVLLYSMPESVSSFFWAHPLIFSLLLHTWEVTWKFTNRLTCQSLLWGVSGMRWGGEEGQTLCSPDSLHLYVVSCGTYSVPVCPWMCSTQLCFSPCSLFCPLVPMHPESSTVVRPDACTAHWDLKWIPCQAALFEWFLSVASVSCWDPTDKNGLIDHCNRLGVLIGHYPLLQAMTLRPRDTEIGWGPFTL